MESKSKLPFADDKRGRDAKRPAEIPLKGWLDVAWRIKSQIGDDRVMLVAAGATFYMLLALFPALAAFVSIYGFVADPVTIADHVSFLAGLLPAGGVDLIRSQLESLANRNSDVLSLSFIFGLLVALWSANNGIKTLFEALNIAYGEKEKRSFVMVNLLAFGFTIGAMLIGVTMIFSVGVVPAIIAFIPMGWVAEVALSFARWPITFIIVAVGISVIYRYGPSREPAKWRWVSWGGIFASVIWIGASAGFSWYLQNFADYDATYGSLGAVIGFMLWTWISLIILIVGAELNAEMEHQTSVDSTTGEPLPMGERGAVMADTVGRSVADDH